MGRDRQLSHSHFRPGLRPWVSAVPKSSKGDRDSCVMGVLGSVLHILNPRRWPCFIFHPSHRSTWGSAQVRAIAGSVWTAGLSERYGFNLNLDGSGTMRHTPSSSGRHPPNLRRECPEHVGTYFVHEIEKPATSARVSTYESPSHGVSKARGT